MALDEREEDLGRGHLELVGSEVHQWHPHLVQLAPHLSSTMVGGIVKEDHCLPPPLLIDGVQVLAQLDHEQEEGIAGGEAFVHSVEEVAQVADGSYQVEALWLAGQGGDVLHTSDQPPSLAMLVQGEDTLIHVDDSPPLIQELDVASSSILPLEEGIEVVIVELHWAYLPVRHIEFRA